MLQIVLDGHVKVNCYKMWYSIISCIDLLWCGIIYFIFVWGLNLYWSCNMHMT